MTPPPPQLPSFLRRRLLLHEARRALLSGAPEDALEHLADPCLALSEDAERLRERVVDVVCREALRAAADGDPERANHLLDRAAREDPERAAHWRRRIDGETDSLDGERPSVALRGKSRAAMGELLAEMRREAEANGTAARTAPGASVRASAPAPPVPLVPPPAVGAEARPLRFHLAVDDAGDYLALGGDEVVIGHRSAERADLPILGDLDSVHARILRSESFHGGPAWMLQPAQGKRVLVAGREAGEGGEALFDGALVELSPQVSFRFALPDPGSSSALVELLHGVECEGASRVLLFAQGPAGRVRAACRADRHIFLRGTRLEFSLELTGSELVCFAPDGVRAPGAESLESSARVAVPPTGSLFLALGRRQGDRPPFGISLREVRVHGSGEWRVEGS